MLRLCRIFIFVMMFMACACKADQNLIYTEDDLTYSVTEDLAVAELWTLSAPETVVSNNGAILAIWAYDSENSLGADEKRPVYLILGGLGDIGETPVAITVFANPSITATLNLTKSRMVSKRSPSAEVSVCTGNTQLYDATAAYCMVIEQNIDGGFVVDSRTVGTVK